MTQSRKIVRLSKAAREFNISMNTIIDFLTKKGYNLEAKPNTKLEPEMYEILLTEFQDEKKVKEIAHQKDLEFVGRTSISIDDKIKPEETTTEEEETETNNELFIKSSTVDFTTQKQPEQDIPIEEEPLVEEKDSTSNKKEEKEKTEEKINEVHPQEATNEDHSEKKEVTIEENIHVKEETVTEQINQPSVKKVKEKEEKPEEIVSEEKPVEVKPEKVHSEEDKQDVINLEPKKVDEKDSEDKEKKGIKILGSIDLDKMNMKTRPARKSKEEKKKEAIKKTINKQVEKKQKNKKEVLNKNKEDKQKSAVKPEKTKQTEPKIITEKKEVNEDNFIPTKVEKLSGPKVVDKINLPVDTPKSKSKKPVASSSSSLKNKKKRRRIRQDNKVQPTDQNKNTSEKHVKAHHKKKTVQKKHVIKHEPTEEEIQKQIKETLARLTAPTGKSKSAKYRRQKRENVSSAHEEELKQQEKEKSILKVTEFLTANDLANMMDANVNDIIKTCLQLGLFISINQRLDAETISILAEEYGYTVKFVDVDEQEDIIEQDDVDDPSELIDRAPIVTVMGHVDHGKTKLLDYVRKANVVAGEAGGITQHIGAYEVTTETGKNITFLDTPGHEAFTAMRARGAKVTDIAIIVIAADDSVMPQTKEAINHAQAAGVPIIFAINKIDKPTANPEKIKEQLANMNILVEDWGGKFQSQEISAITGAGIPELLEKVLLEAEMLELKANPNRPAKGTVLEASLDKGRGYVANILVENGTLRKGDILIAGPVFGRVKAMYNERAKTVSIAGPAVPVLLLGLTGAPQAGDIFQVMKDEKEAKTIATKRQQLLREQSLRSQKHITLDEIGRRIAIGDFKELNIIVKGDVDGSIEALSDVLLKLSTPEVQVNIIHKAVGAITESDILLASASDAIIIGFQVRPMPKARKLAETEQIDIRLYSIIYQATEEIEAAIEGMLAPKMEEKVVCNLEVRNTFKISKVGTIAGCYVLDGKIHRNTKIRLIRDGIVIYTGFLGSLKRFKDDVKEVSAGYECGLNIENYNDIKVGDYIEGFEEVEVARKK